MAFIDELREDGFSRFIMCFQLLQEARKYFRAEDETRP